MKLKFYALRNRCLICFGATVHFLQNLHFHSYSLFASHFRQKFSCICRIPICILQNSFGHKATSKLPYLKSQLAQYQHSPHFPQHLPPGDCSSWVVTKACPAAFIHFSSTLKECTHFLTLNFACFQFTVFLYTCCLCKCGELVGWVGSVASWTYPGFALCLALGLEFDLRNHGLLYD